MNEIDAMRLLADANPVQPEDLTPLDAPSPSPPSRRRLGAAIAIAAVAATVLVGVFTFNGSHSARSAGEPRLHVPRGATGANGATGGNGATGENGPGPTHVTPDPEDNEGLSDRLHRDGGKLTTVDFTLWEYERAGFRLRVRYLGPKGDYISPYEVVYETQVAPSDTTRGIAPSGDTAWIWQAMLSTSDWSSCKPGDYEVDVDSYDGSTFRWGMSTNTFSCR